MKRLGFLDNGSNNMNFEEASKKFDRFFGEIVDIQNFPAMRDLFPAARELSDDELMAALQQAGMIVRAGAQ